MTNKEAASLLGWLKSKTNREDDLEAIEMAMQALQGSDDDLISRADAIEAVKDAYEMDEFYKVISEDIVNALSALPSAEGSLKAIKRQIGEHWYLGAPSAEAAQGWRTGKPTENGEYMVTLDAWGHRYINIMHYAKPQMPNRNVDGMCWYRSDDEWGDVVYDDNDILAWMPLPKPYKGGEDE